MQNFNYKQQHSSWKKDSYLIYQNDLWKKKRRKKILLTKKPHVFGLSIFNIYCNKQIISKEKKKNTTNIGWDIYSRLFNWPLIQTTGVESLSAQINMMISSSFTPFFWNPTFFFFSFFQSFRIIAKQSFSMQKCTLTRGFRRKPACLFMEYAGTMQIQVAAHTSCRTRLNTDISLTYTIFNTDDVSSFVRFVDFCHKTTSVML